MKDSNLTGNFLIKTKLGIENLSKLYDKVTDKRSFSETVTDAQNIIISLSILDLHGYWLPFLSRYRERMEIRLDSSNISLLLFGFYKMSMFCTYREIHNRKNITPVF